MKSNQREPLRTSARLLMPALVLTSACTGVDAGAGPTAMSDAGGLPRGVVPPFNDAQASRATPTLILDGVELAEPERTAFAEAPRSERTPEILYPGDAVMLPPNANMLEVHFLAAGYDLFQLSLDAANTRVEVVFACVQEGEGCVYRPSEEAWEAISLAGRRVPSLRYTITGISRADLGSRGESSARSLRVAQSDLRGGLYYWAGGVDSIRRFDFGLGTQASESFIDASVVDRLWFGLHSLSHDGSRIAVGLLNFQQGWLYGFGVLDVARRELVVTSQEAGLSLNAFALSPSGRRVALSNAQGVSVVDVDTQQTVSVAPGWQAVGLDFSPDETQVVHVSHQAGPLPPSSQSVGLALSTLRGGEWTTSRLVGFDGGGYEHPAFSPDGQWVVFTHSPTATIPSDSSLRFVHASSASGESVALACTGESRWGRWSPESFVQGDGSIFWLTFTTEHTPPLYDAPASPGLPRGFRLRPQQLWMVAFDPAAASRGESPCGPPFWLRFQDRTVSHQSAQWVTNVARRPCAATSECAGAEICHEGSCLPELI